MIAAIRVGTRGSPLALVQTRAVIARLGTAEAALAATEVVIRTTGDAVQDRPLAEVGGKGLFAKEIHEALRDRRIDLAVHSLKDLEIELPEGIALAYPLPREDPRDVLLLGHSCAPPDPERPFATLPRGAVVGTASARRQAQLLHARPDLRVTILRGNVQTRLAKLAAGACNASVLALAGLRRLGLSPENTVPLDPAVMLPAAGQGIIGVTYRTEDTRMAALLARIEDRAAGLAATAERAVLAALGGSCRTPIAAQAALGADGVIRLTGLTARANGTFLLRRSLEGPAADAARLGGALGARLRAESPPDLFA
ncbi:MAG TPA: hydroxymethylbilane synthase [Acetobacteraceae bacterium]|nr:hydroxymethylbilane synthase [Acetobacteraceae bacterium]